MRGVQTFIPSSSGSAGGGYDATAYQMIKTAVSAAAITAGWELADQREVFDRLAYNLYGVSISEVTADAAFDNATDSLALAQNADFIADINAEPRLLALGLASAELVDYAAVYGMDLSTGSYASKSVFVQPQESSPFGLAFSADGSAMYVCGQSSDTVYQYTLSTPWDVSTASYASKSLNVNSNGRDPAGMAFSPDGSTLFVVGSYANTVYQYTLSTPWDISTGSYASKSLSVFSQEGSPFGIAASPDGLNLYIVGQANDTIYQYTLSTAWDVSTASYASKSLSVSSQETDPSGLAFTSDGSSVFIVGSSTDTAYQYTLSTPWDISTGSYASKSLGLVSQDSSPRDIAFSADGTKCFVVGIATDTVYQYSGTALSGGVFVQAA